MIRLSVAEFVCWEPLWNCERSWYYIVNEHGQQVSYFGPTPGDAWKMVYLWSVEDLLPGDEVRFE